MDPELLKRVDALRRPLELAAKDNFAGVRKITGLGIALRAACDGIIAKAPSEVLAQWREAVASWEQLAVEQQEVIVARGMRLLARFPQTRTIAAPRDQPTIASLLAKAPPPPVAPPKAEPKVVPAKRASVEAPPEAEAKVVPAKRASVESPPEAEAAEKSVRAKRASADVEAPAAEKSARAKRASVEVEAPAEKSVRAKRASVEVEVMSEPKASGEKNDPMAAPTHSLPGIGPAFAERLAEKGLETVEDLLWCLPKRYDDVRDAKPLDAVAALDDGVRATFVAKVVSSRMVFVRRKRWGDVRLAAVDPARPASALVRFWNVWAGIEKKLPAGSIVTLSGVVRRRGGLEFANPDVIHIELAPDQLELAGAAKTKREPPAILVRYNDVAGVPAGALRKACQTACARVGANADDGVPASVERAARLPSLGETLAQLHSPPADISTAQLALLNAHTTDWQKRLVFGELFALGVAVALKRRERRADAAMPCARTPKLADAIATALPFTPTGAQARTIREIGDDLEKPVPMNRLLQGDVGSGKTAVAFAAAVQVARAGRQTAVMAPTEILAEQHAETWRVWSKSAGLRVELLTASTPKAVRQSLIAMLASKQIDVLIGTHALLAEGVGFGALGLVVIDEQHRFGVAQRARLRDKGDGQGAPHLLVMTATPIPRTLALTAYGDLDASVLDELPPGRKPVATTLETGKRGEAKAYKLIAECAARGERAYVVCPKIEDAGADASSDWKDATTVAKDVAKALPDLRVGLVHGRLDTDKRDRVMRAFKQGELDVLVATTVIEVGVDVPAATVMVVHDADRFGLAQLHQLRGRVGRGGSASRCVLVTQGGITEEGRQRLDAMAATTDGFKIAEADLALRGPGELCGPRQAGVPRLRFGDLGQHFELLLEARRHARAILDDDPDLVRPEHASLRDALARRLAQSVYGAESG